MQMRTYRVTTPTPEYTGEVGGVHFVRGEAIVEAPAPLERLPYADEEGGQLTRRQLAERDEIGQHAGYRAMSYFRAQGYGVEDITPEPGQPVNTGDAPPPAKNASTDEWRAWFVATGRLDAAAAGALSRDELIAAYAKEGMQ